MVEAAGVDPASIIHSLLTSLQTQSVKPVYHMKGIN